RDDRFFFRLDAPRLQRGFGGLELGHTLIATAFELGARFLEIRAELVDGAEPEEHLQRRPLFALRLVDEVGDRSAAKKKGLARDRVDGFLVRLLRRDGAAELARRFDRDERS